MPTYNILWVEINENYEDINLFIIITPFKVRDPSKFDTNFVSLTTALYRYRAYNI